MKDNVCHLPTPLLLLQLALLLLFAPAAAAQTNSWMKPTSGQWTEAFWSLGPPLPTHSVMFTNAGYKALALYPGTLVTISNLQISSPPDSLNTLLLNYTGLGTPHRVARSVVVGTNAVLLTLFSALQIDIDGLFVGGTVRHGEFSQLTTPAAYLGMNGPATYNFSNGIFRTDLLFVADRAPASFNQTDGTNVSAEIVLGHEGHGGSYTLNLGILSADTIRSSSGQGTFLHAGGTNFARSISLGDWRSFSGLYVLSNGLLQSAFVNLGGESFGRFEQWGGVHLGRFMNLRGDTYYPSLATYALNGGLLCLSNINLNFAGVFFQTGGSNYVADTLLAISGGFYRLDAGTFATHDATIIGGLDDVESGFAQNGGLSIVSNRLTIRGQPPFSQPAPTTYQLQAGALVARDIEIQSFGELVHSGGVITNQHTLTLDAGILRTIGQTAPLGQLIVAQTSFGFDVDSRIELNGAASRLRFADSSTASWPGAAKLIVLSWNGSPTGGGSDQLIFGATPRGLTVPQLSRIEFLDPAGFTPGRYPARILANGEVVPATRPTLGFAGTLSEVHLTWSGTFILQTATNVTGPYSDLSSAASPYTNVINTPTRFFRLRKP